ncbi:MAG: O-antigen ligase family protein [Flavobacteriales bacterium]
MAVGIYMEFFYVLLLPFVFAVLWAAFFKVDYVFYTIVFFTPLSLNLEDLDVGGVGMYLPTEPLLFGLLVLFVFKLIHGQSINKKIFTHPVSYFLYIYLGWMLLTTITSEMPLVSLKFVVTRMWFIATCFFLATHLFQDTSNIKKYFILYLIPLFGVIFYTVSRHAEFGFDKQSAHWVMEPLFKDHTSYGAVLAMYFPVVLGLLFLKKQSLLNKSFFLIGFIILTTGLVLSFTRAAWVSVVGAAAVLMVMQTRVRLSTLVITGAVAAIVTLFSWEQIQIALESNKQESSDNLDEHVSSISNVSSDASNLERLNRWNCAIELWKERPVMGWGPGVYQFVYAPYQRSQDLTIISTKSGDGGNAHSEYLGPLSEQGVMGMALMVVFFFMICHYGFKLYYRTKSYEHRLLALMAFMGLITYLIHGVLNNYLDTDKASIPFWGFIAVMVAIDMSNSEEEKKALTNS